MTGNEARRIVAVVAEHGVGATIAGPTLASLRQLAEALCVLEAERHGGAAMMRAAAGSTEDFSIDHPSSGET